MSEKHKNRVKIINDLGVVESRSDLPIKLKKAGDTVVIYRNVPRALVMMCPCGCGDQLTINLDQRSDKAWRLYRSNNGLSLYPSVWRESNCFSHFILWNNSIFWCDYESLYQDSLLDNNLVSQILETLSIKRSIHYVELAEKIGQIPWSVLVVCKRLAKQQEIEMTDEKGYFRLKEPI